MKKYWFINLLVLFLLLSIATSSNAQGVTETQAPGTWVSSINIQNTSDSEAAVVLTFYNSDGSIALEYVVDPPLAAHGSRSLYIPDAIDNLADGQYSVIVSSNQQLEIVANSSSTTPSTAGAYSGLQSYEIAKNVFFPGLYNNYFGFHSEILLQNTEDTNATVTITFYNQKTGSQVKEVSGINIPAKSTRVFAMADISELPLGDEDGLLSARVTSDKKLAAIANIWTSAYHGELSDYNAYVSGSTSVVYAPALYNAYYGFVSSLTVQNVDTVDAEIEVTYSNGETETKTLSPNQAFEYYQPHNAALPSGNTDGVFSAQIKSLNNAEIVVLVNIENKNKGLLASYNGPSTATTSINVPVVLKSFYQWFSAQTVQNVGTNPTDITITYATGETATFENIPANGTVNIIELDYYNSVLPDGSSVSAVIESSGEPIVAVVQENSNYRYSQTPGDYLLAYTGIEQ